MANGLDVLNRSLKGMSALAITRSGLNSKVVYNFPKPRNIQIQENIEQKEQEGSNDAGDKVRQGSYGVGRKPTLKISFGYMQPEMIAFKMGQQLETVASLEDRYPKQDWVTQGDFPGATGTGFLGNGVEVDVGLTSTNWNEKPWASYTKNEISVPLTQAAWDDYETWRLTMGKFAIGANGARRYSNDLVATQEIVSLSIPHTITGQQISDLLVGSVQIQVAAVNSINKVVFITAYAATVDLSGAGLDFSADGIELDFFLNNPPGKCRAWNMLATDLDVKC